LTNLALVTDQVNQDKRELMRQHSLGSQLEATYTQAFSRLIYVRRDERFDVVNRPYLRAILEANCLELTQFCSRQVGKTTGLGGNAILHGVANPGYGHLYVAPRGDQAKTFSRMVFDSTMRRSPFLRKQIPSGKTETWQLGTKVMRNGSYYHFKSAYHSADAIRGYTAGYIYKDEMQDLISDHQAVIDEVASNWVDARFFNSGTPKTFSNLLEQKWQRSTQANWMIHCQACGYWNYQDEHMMGKKGLICKRCGKGVDPKVGEWVMAAPDRADVHQGFRVTQYMNPNQMAKYPQMLEKLETYPKVQFYNEVLGLSYAEGDAVLSRDDIMRACHPTRRNNPAVAPSFPGVVTSGVDYGSGNLLAKRHRGDTQRSYTVVVSGALSPAGVYEVLYIKRFHGVESDLDMQPRWINQLLHMNRTAICMADWGFGAVQNRRMVNEFGWDPNRFVEVQESAGQREFVKWNPAAGRYIINRNELFVRVIEDIKKGRITFPCREDMEPFVADFTSIYVELDGIRNERRYDHTFPDDTFHALAYAYISALMEAGIVSRYVMPLDSGEFYS